MPIYELPRDYEDLVYPLDDGDTDQTSFELTVSGHTVKVQVTRRDEHDKEDGYRIYAFNCNVCDSDDRGKLKHNEESVRFAPYIGMTEFETQARDAIDDVLRQLGASTEPSELDNAIAVVMRQYRERRVEQFNRDAAEERAKFERELDEQLAEIEARLRS